MKATGAWLVKSKRYVLPDERRGYVASICVVVVREVEVLLMAVTLGTAIGAAACVVVGAVKGWW